MTSLEYTMTVRDVVTNQVQVYEKTGSDPCGGWDLKSFPFQATPTPGGAAATPTAAPPTPTNAPNQTNSPTRTRTPTPTQHRHGDADRHADADAAARRRSRCASTSWQWDWCPSSDQGYPLLACTMGACPYEIGPGTARQERDHAARGLHVPAHALQRRRRGRRPDAAPQDQRTSRDRHARHDAPGGQIMPPITITIPAGASPTWTSTARTRAAAAGGDPGATHEMMLGTIHIAP